MKKLSLLLSSTAVAVFGVVPLLSHAADPVNLITNSSFETAVGNVPANWQKDTWGRSTTTFGYETTGHTGARSASVTVIGRTSGDAKWMHDPVTVKPGTVYAFSDWYQSTVKSSVDVVVTSTSGAINYYWLGDLAASSTWKQASYRYTMPADAKTAVFYHYLKANGRLTTDDYSLTDSSVAPPTVSLSAPAAGATVSGTVAISANASDATSIASVQFRLDGVNLGAADTTAPYSFNWNTASTSNGSHSLTAVATNAGGVSASSAPVAVNVSNTAAAPTVSVTAPAAGSTVSGTVSVTASASDATGITGVQFKLDGANLGVADTTAPYGISWDTKTASDGSHSLSAVATNTGGTSATSSPVTVIVSNPVTPPTTGNLVANPSVETANGTAPASWSEGGWGTNTRSLTYETTGHTGSRSLRASISSYTNGDVKWVFAPVAVTPGSSYTYSNWYKASVASELDAMVEMTDGSVQYLWLGSLGANTGDWQQAKAQFTAPAGAKTVSIFQVISAVGYVQTDDYSLTAESPAQTQFNRGLVSLTFDDGWRNIYANGLPLLGKYGLPSTQYLLTGTTDYPDYMTVAMMQAFKDQGSEIAAHTVDHLDLTKQTLATVDSQLRECQASLRGWFGTPGVADNFATPYGAYSNTVITEIKKFYRSHRSTDVGYNNKTNFDIYNIKVQNVTNTTTPAQVKAWVDSAIANKTWLVIVYHEVTANAADPTYAVTPANLDAELSAIKTSGVAVKTVQQALDEIVPQL